jgi:glycine cleavage system H lipoate-binding protein
MNLKLITHQDQDRDCVWMQAGVVPYKQCRHEYRCSSCSYDMALRRTADRNVRAGGASAAASRKSARIEHWEERLKKRPALQRPCIHAMKKEIEFRPCSREYQCAQCDFHQFFQDVFSVYAVLTPVDLLEVHGVHVPQGYYLHRGHAWAKLEEKNVVRIGLDDFALRLMGPLDEARTPLVGKKVRRGQPVLSVERDGHRARVLSPVSGVVLETNPELRKDATLANAKPYGQGWFLQVYASELRSELKELMLGQEAEEFLSAELDRLYGLIEEVHGPLAADGGVLVDDIYGNLPGVEWSRLCTSFGLLPDSNL